MKNLYRNRCLTQFSLFVFVLLIGFIVRYATLTSFAQTGNPSAYIYDDKGQVRAVVAQTGEATVYDYDAAGNFVGIRRLNSDAFEVLTFSPREGVVGTRVRIYGIGFSAGITSVAFNGTAATVVSSDSISVTATVPNGATTGPITVVSPRGTRTTAIPFTVRGIAIQPAAVNLPSGFSQQFTANIVGLPSANIIWSVNGLNNGNNEVGTISNTGLYVAPFVLGLLPRQFAVRATSADSPGDFAEAVVTVQPFDATVTPSLFTQPHGAGLRGLSPATVAATTNIRWQKTLPRGIGHGSITFSNNGEFLYFKTAGGSHQGIVYKVRASDGTTVWETNPATIGFGSASNSGITIDETAGRVYTSGRSDSLPAGGSIVTALNINDGSVIWSRKVIDLNANIGDVGDSIMLLSPDRTRIYTRDNRSPNSIIALDAANGNLIWRQQITTGGTGLVYFTVGPVWTDPASGKPRIAYINNLTTNSVGVIQDDGVTASLAWSRNIALGLNYKWWGNAMANGNDTQLYITSFSDAGNPVVTALNAANGATVWQIFSSTNGMNQYANPAIGVDGTIYSPGRMTGSVGGLTAIRPNGTIKWQIRPTGSLELTSWAVATAGGVVYVSDQASNLLYAIKDNTNNATVLWQFQLTGSVGTGVTSPSVGPDGTVYVATGSTDTGSRILYALRP